MRNKFKDKTAGKSDYSHLRSKIFIHLLGTVMIALFFVTLFYKCFWSDRGGNWTVAIFQRLFLMDHYNAMNLYQQIFRNYVEIVWVIAIAFAFLVVARFAINRFTRYFDIVNKGIDALLDDDEQIHLPSEMSATERKLNAVKQTLKQRTLEAKLAEQRKNDLVMYLAHDIRTPLTSVIGYLNLLEEAPDMPTEQRANYVHITLDKAYRLEKMINEFFEISRYNLQQIALIKENIDLYYMLVQITDELSPILTGNGNTAKLKADENLTVYGDPDRLARVFNNVLKNAAAYSYPDTEIVISAERKDSGVIISFQNKGHTISKEKLTAIFEKFYRLDEARSSNTGGAGLGLAIAREIITLHGGTITAESADDTITFIIALPAY